MCITTACKLCARLTRTVSPMMRTKQRCCNVDLLECMHEKRSNRLLVSSCWVLYTGRVLTIQSMYLRKFQAGRPGADPCSSWRSHSRPHTQLTRGRFEPLSLRLLKPPAQTLSPAFLAPQCKSRHSLWRCQSLQSRDPRPSGDHSDPYQPTLAQLCHLIQQGFFEVGRKHSAAPLQLVRGLTMRQCCCSTLYSSLCTRLSLCRHGIPLTAAPVAVQVGHWGIANVGLSRCMPRMQLCLHNMGRPAAAALTDVVRGAVGAAAAGHSLERLRLQVILVCVAELPHLSSHQRFQAHKHQQRSEVKLVQI